MKAGHKVEVVAHRGYSARYPENTMAAFKAAIGKADMVELDVFLSKDKELVVFHDEMLDRVTKASGNVFDFTLKELRRFDAGSWFSSEFGAEKIPTLREVLTALKGKLKVNIEIKELEADGQVQLGIEEKCAALIRDLDMKRQTVVSSYNHNAMLKLHEIDPAINTALIIDFESKTSPVTSNTDIVEYVARYKAGAVHLDKMVVNKGLVEKLHEKGIIVGVFTIVSQAELDRCRDIGVDRVITDYLEGYEDAKR